MKHIVFKYLIDNKIIQIETEKPAVNTAEIFNGNKIVLSGNRLGLIDLADRILDIALSDVDNYHIHLDGVDFFENADCEVIILKQSEFNRNEK